MDEGKVSKLTDVLVSCAMTIHTNRTYFDGKSVNEVGEWISEQLRECGFPNGPCGASHVHLDRSLFGR